MENLIDLNWHSQQLALSEKEVVCLYCLIDEGYITSIDLEQIVGEPKVDYYLLAIAHVYWYAKGSRPELYIGDMHLALGWLDLLDVWQLRELRSLLAEHKEVLATNHNNPK